MCIRDSVHVVLVYIPPDTLVAFVCRLNMHIAAIINNKRFIIYIFLGLKKIFVSATQYIVLLCKETDICYSGLALMCLSVNLCLVLMEALLCSACACSVNLFLLTTKLNNKNALPIHAMLHFDELQFCIDQIVFTYPKKMNVCSATYPKAKQGECISHHHTTKERRPL